MNSANSAQRVPVLMYHRVGHAADAWEWRYAISPEGFAAHMAALDRAGYRPVTIDALADWLEGGPALPRGAVLITFDDGFRGVAEHALPILEARSWPFTVFLVSDLIGGEDVWDRNANPGSRTHPLLDADEIHDMARRGCSFHSHSRSHASLPQLDDATLISELAGSRAALGRLLGAAPEFIAYPYGRVDERVAAAARAAGYRAAFSTQPGFNRRDVDRFRIRRLDIAGSDNPAMLLRKMRLGSNDGSLSHAVRYYVGRLAGRLVGG